MMADQSRKSAQADRVGLERLYAKCNAYEDALQAITEVDAIDAALDPQRPVRIAEVTLQRYRRN
jgi:hypothetical protein